MTRPTTQSVGDFALNQDNAGIQAEETEPQLTESELGPHAGHQHWLLMAFKSTQSTTQIQESISTVAKQEPKHRLRFVLKCEILTLLIAGGLLLALVVVCWGILPFHEGRSRVMLAVCLVILTAAGECALLFHVRARLRGYRNLRWFVIHVLSKEKWKYRSLTGQGVSRSHTVRRIHTDHGTTKVDEEWYQYFQKGRHYLVFGCDLVVFGSRFRRSVRFVTSEHSVFELPELPPGYRYSERTVVAESD